MANPAFRATKTPDAAAGAFGKSSVLPTETLTPARRSPSVPRPEVPRFCRSCWMASPLRMLTGVHSEEDQGFSETTGCTDDQDCKYWRPFCCRSSQKLRNNIDVGYFDSCLLVPFERPLFDLASRLRIDHGINTPEAFHLAAALTSECDPFFYQRQASRQGCRTSTRRLGLDTHRTGSGPTVGAEIGVALVGKAAGAKVFGDGVLHGWGSPKAR